MTNFRWDGAWRMSSSSAGCALRRSFCRRPNGSASRAPSVLAKVSYPCGVSVNDRREFRFVIPVLDQRKRAKDSSSGRHRVDCHQLLRYFYGLPANVSEEKIKAASIDASSRGWGFSSRFYFYIFKYIRTRGARECDFSLSRLIIRIFQARVRIWGSWDSVKGCYNFGSIQTVSSVLWIFF